MGGTKLVALLDLGATKIKRSQCKDLLLTVVAFMKVYFSF